MSTDKPYNSGKKWSDEEVAKLEKFIQKGYDAEQIGSELGRTAEAVEDKVDREGFHLLPKDEDSE